MTTITKEFQFDAAHRLLNHEGKCKHVHGHRYVVELTVTAPELDGLGRVIDFSVLKEKVGTWIDAFLDHGTIVFSADDSLLKFLRFEIQKYYVLSYNPTAENIAREICDVAQGLLSPDGITIVEVTVHETPTCRATHRLPRSSYENRAAHSQVR